MSDKHYNFLFMSLPIGTRGRSFLRNALRALVARMA